MVNFVHVRTYGDPEEAYIALGALESTGLNCRLESTEHLSVAPGLRIALGGYRLFAIEPHAAEAESFLLEIENAPATAPIGADEPCPRCGGLAFRRLKSRAWSVAAVLLIMPFVVHRGRSVCLNCGLEVDAEGAARRWIVWAFVASSAAFTPLFVTSVSDFPQLALAITLFGALFIARLGLRPARKAQPETSTS